MPSAFLTGILILTCRKVEVCHLQIKKAEEFQSEKQMNTEFFRNVITTVELKTYLTHNMPHIHTSFTYSTLNVDEICGLKFYLLYVHTSQKILLKSLHAQRRSFLLLNLYF